MGMTGLDRKILGCSAAITGWLSPVTSGSHNLNANTFKSRLSLLKEKVATAVAPRVLARQYAMAA